MRRFPVLYQTDRVPRMFMSTDVSVVSREPPVQVSKQSGNPWGRHEHVVSRRMGVYCVGGIRLSFTVLSGPVVTGLSILVVNLNNSIQLMYYCTVVNHDETKMFKLHSLITYLAYLD